MLAAFFLIILGVLGACIEGVMLTYVWAWFMVPLGLPAIGWAHACGLAILVSLFTMRGGGYDPRTNDEKLWDGLVWTVTSVFTFALLTTIAFFFSFGV